MFLDQTRSDRESSLADSMPPGVGSTISLSVSTERSLVGLALRRALSDAEYIRLVGESDLSPTGVCVVARLRPAVALLDIGDAFHRHSHLLELFRSTSQETAIVLVSMEPCPTLAKHARRMGAHGVLARRAMPDEMLRVVRALALERTRGTRAPAMETGVGRRGYAGPLLARPTLGMSPVDPRPWSRERSGRLTTRERQVLPLLAAGYTNAQVGLALGISRHTAEAHRKHLREKLEAYNVAGLVSAAIALGASLALADRGT